MESSVHTTCSMPAGNEHLEPAQMDAGTAHELTLTHSGFCPWCGEVAPSDD